MHARLCWLIAVSTLWQLCPTWVNGENDNCSAVSYGNCSTGLPELTVLGLFELNENGPGGLQKRREGYRELAAVRLAIHHLRSMQSSPDLTISLIVNDTKSDPGVGLDTFFHAVWTKEQKMAVLLGSASSEVTENLAKVTPYWNMLHVSFGATSPALSDRREFPFFFRTVAPDSSHNPARIALLKHFNWRVVAALSENEDVYSLAVNDLVTELELANITCRTTVTFAETDLKEQLALLKDFDTRIIIGSFSPSVALQVFCEAYHLEMYGGDYAWLLSSRNGDRWWDPSQAPCQPHELALVTDGSIFVSSYSPLKNSSFFPFYNKGFEELIDELDSTSGGGVGLGFAPEAYDAVLAIYLAAKGLPIDEFDYKRRDLVEQLHSKMSLLEFYGISGPITFDGPDRIGVTAFHQLQGGASVMVGIYDGHLLNRCPGCAPFVWPGGSAPVDQRLFKLKPVTVDPTAFLVVASFSAVGICLASFFFLLNQNLRKNKYFKLSSPKLSGLTVVGCILVYTAVILLGLDSAILPSPSSFPTVCTARVYLLSAGFSMAFGSMFAKTYRVHRIFTRSAQGMVKKKLLQDTQLISMICVLLVVDGLIVTVWVTVDPIIAKRINLTLEISPEEKSIVYQPQIEVCSSEYIDIWLSVLYMYKGLLLVVGLYMAWETRHVKIAALNDSQHIGLSVYSVVITTVLVVVLANLVSERVTFAFLCISLPILTSTTGCLCLLFLPKLWNIRDRPEGASDGEDPVMRSMGLKIECNTRRFATDDRSERLFRVEVQNRVYRRELQLLQTEIAQLERAEHGIVDVSSEASTSTVRKSSEVDIEATPGRAKSSSVGGGIPLLLLSVLPSAIIPRASWPTEMPTASDSLSRTRQHVTFISEPELDPVPQTKPSMLGRLVSMIITGGRKGGSQVIGNSSSSGSSLENPHKFAQEITKARSAQSLPRVSFSLSEEQERSESNLSSSNKRLPGSPRCPYRIIPAAKSLNALRPPQRPSDETGKSRSLEDARSETHRNVGTCEPAERAMSFNPML